MPQQQTTSLNGYTSLYETEILNNLSVNSGALAVIDENIEMFMNDYGQYNYRVKDGAPSKSAVDKKLTMVSAMSDTSPNEDDIAKSLFSNIEGIKHKDIAGYYLETYAGHVIEGDYRANASSGGFATWLLVQLFEKGLIDGVIHVKDFDDGDGILFKCTISESVAEIKAGAKSRYYPCEFSGELKEIKKKTGNYAVVGIPSFITEIRLLAQQDDEIAKRIKYTFGLICGHQKSAKYAEALAWEHGIKPGDLQKIDFRKKLPGEPANKYISEFTGLIDGNKVTFTKDQTELFVSNWGHGFFKAPLSDFTDDTLNETADISLGDAWLPEYTKDSMGNNVLIVRNKDILDIIESGISENKVIADKISPETVIRSQSGLVHHTHDELPYRLYKKDRLNIWRPKKRVEASKKLPPLRRKVQDIREGISTGSHEHYRRAVELNNWTYFHRKTVRLTSTYQLTYTLLRARNLSLAQIKTKLAKKLRR